jgi:UDP-2-acetamido-2-deoxy-ribo-hexuluronate aminotransferase
MDIHRVLDEVLESNDFIGNNIELENELETYLETPLKCITVGNGTDALELVYRECSRLRPNATVICVPSFTFSATASAVIFAGLQVHYIDVDPTLGSYSVTPKTVRQTLEEVGCNNIVAFALVSLYGQTPDFKTIRELIPSNIPLIEDAAQSFGSYSSFGNYVNFACTSFYPSKNIGCYGDAGAIFCQPEHVISLRGSSNHGRGLSSDRIGKNSRMDKFQALILRQKIAKFDSIKQSKLQIADWYEFGLRDLGNYLVTPHRKEGTCFSVYTLHIINAQHRDCLFDYLVRSGVQARIYYNEALCQEHVNSVNKSRSVLSIPIFPFMTEDECSYICNCIQVFFNNPGTTNLRI